MKHFSEFEISVCFRYLKEFRTQQCPDFLQHKCTRHRPYTCFHWHFVNQKRRRPVKRRDGRFNYSPDIYCPKYDETTGVCPDGDEWVCVECFKFFRNLLSKEMQQFYAWFYVIVSVWGYRIRPNYEISLIKWKFLHFFTLTLQDYYQLNYSGSLSENYEASLRTGHSTFFSFPKELSTDGTNWTKKLLTPAL